ncbi:MAG: elongation factor P [Firmicutes bacterium]|nr:elongation factor P [Bacillota bacterium]
MISAGDVRKSMNFEHNGVVFTCVDFQHTKVARGGAVVWIKMKNIKTGSITENTFVPTDKFERVSFEEKPMQYLYRDGDLFYIMDLESYEQIPFDKAFLGDTLDYVVENENVIVRFFKDQPFSVAPPLFVIREITECEPAVQGSTANASFKPAVLETGLKVQVPLFVSNHDKIKVDTRTGEYVERA